MLVIVACTLAITAVCPTSFTGAAFRAAGNSVVFCNIFLFRFVSSIYKPAIINCGIGRHP